MKENNDKNDKYIKESKILLQLPQQINDDENTQSLLRSNNCTKSNRNDSQKSLFRLSSTFVECYCRIELKFVWYVSYIQYERINCNA